MKNNKTKPHNRNSSTSTTTLRRAGLGLLVLSGFAGYWLLFLEQPSLFGFVDQEGERVQRFVDLLVMPSLFPSMWGYGDLPLGLVDRIPLLAGLLAWLTLAYWLGSPLVTYGLPGLSRPERLALSTLAGLAILSTATLCLGLAGLLINRWPLLIAVTGLGLLSGWARTVWKPPLHGDATDTGEEFAAATSVGVWSLRLIPALSCVLAAGYLLCSCLPAWEFDVLEYHLQAPREFHAAGEVRFMPHNIYANMPLAIEMHSLSAMTLLGGEQAWWWGGLWGKSISGSFSLLAAMLVGGFISRHCGRSSGWISAGLLLATPGNMHVALAGLIDMGLAAYVLASYVAIVQIARSPHWTGQRWASLFTAGLFAGAAAATKYPGLVYAVVPLCLALAWMLYDWKSPRAWLLGLSAVGLGLCLTCVPWYAKNAYFTGNPIYPLGYEIFGGGGLDDARAGRWSQAHDAGEAAFSLSAAWDSALQLTLRSSFLNPSLLFLAVSGAILGLVGLNQPPGDRLSWVPGSRLRHGLGSQLRQGLAELPRSDRKGWVLVCLGLGLWILAVWWTATHRIDRFWLPLLPLFAVLGGFAAQQLGQKLAAGAVAAMVLPGLFYGCLVMASSAGLMDNRFFVSLSAIERQASDYQHSGLVDPVTAWINAELSDEAGRLLLIGEAKAFHFRPDIVYATCFDINPAETWLRTAEPAEQRANLQREGISHVLVNWGEIERYRSPGNYGFSDWPQRQDIDRLVSEGVAERIEHPFDPDRVDILRVLPR